MALAGISTLGIKFGYAVESSTAIGTKPTSFTTLHRINSIGELSIEPESIDASALEDMVTRYIAGRSSVSETVAIDVNFTSDTQAEWEAVIDAYSDLTGGAQMWFEVVIPGYADGFFFIAQPPTILPMPSIGQNELLTMTINLVVADYKGLDTKVALS